MVRLRIYKYIIMQLDTQQIKHLAQLARLELSTAEQEKYTKQLGDILDYFEKLTHTDTKNIKLTSQSINLKNINRLDEVKNCEPKVVTTILDNSPDKSGDYIKVNKVL